jgi:hypothetical protein
MTIMGLVDCIESIVKAVSYDFVPGSETDFDDGLGGSWYYKEA